MTRRVVLLALALVVACDRSDPVTPIVNGPSNAIVDGGHGGNSHFFFLPPIAPPTAFSGTFDPAAAPTVEICALSGPSCGATVATFTTTSGSGSEIIRVDAGDQRYIVNWHTGDFALNNTTTYRIRVLVRGVEVGQADVVVGANGRALRGIDGAQFVSLVNGQTLPIKFRLEIGAVQCDTVVTTTANNFVANVSAGMIRPLTPAIGNAFYLDTIALFGSGLIVGTSGADVEIGYNTRLGTSDFDGAQQVCAILDAAGLRTVAEVHPLAAGIPGLAIRQETFSFTNAADDDYLLLRYSLTNTGSGTITGLRAGYVADFDLYFDGSPSGASNDVVRFETGLGFPSGVVSELDTLLHPARIGIVPAAATSLSAYTGYRNASPGPIPSDPPTPAGFFGFLAGGIVPTPVGPSDIRELLGFGPVNLAPGQTVVVDFALVGGLTRAAFAANASAARAKAIALGF